MTNPCSLLSLQSTHLKKQMTTAGQIEWKSLINRLFLQRLQWWR